MVYTKTGGLDVLKIMELPKPVPKDNQVLISVKAAALNVADSEKFKSLDKTVPISTRIMNIIMGFKGAPIGAEIAGIVECVGKNVSGLKKGDKVFGKTAGLFPKGAFAEYALMDKERVCIMPDNYTFEEAACVSISFETALAALRKANIKKDSQVMVYGSSGGVGLFTVQIAKAMGGIVTGVCSTRNIDIAKEYGCASVIDYKKEDFTKTTQKYDAIIGVNGCNDMSTYHKLLKDDGIFVGVGNGKQALKALFKSFISSQFTFVAGMVNMEKGYLQYAKELAEKEQLKPYMDKVYSVSDTQNAIKYMVTSHAQGKIVVKMDF